jgi:predicted dithiol-disulfide oxidoreductase (DUF899 family)
MGWSFPWASSFGSDFNYDFAVSFTEEQQLKGGVEYNYRRQAPAASEPLARTTTPAASRAALARQPAVLEVMAAMTGVDVPTYHRERPGMSAFVLEDGIVYHTYSTYARGVDALWGMYPWLDRAPKGRNETGVWWRRHDEYDER